MKRQWMVFLLVVAIGFGLFLSPNLTVGAADKQRITIWHMEEPPNRVERFKEIVNTFNKANPNIEIDIQLQNWGDVYIKAPGAIKSGNGPDLLFTIPDFTTLIKKLNVIQPADDIINKLDAKHRFIKAAITPYKYNGHIWAVPIYGMVQVLWYRKDLFNAAGIQPPKTWDELLQAAQILTKGDVKGIALPASKSMATDQVIYSFMITAGAKDIIDQRNKVTFNNPNTVRAYDMYAKLLKYSPADSNTYQWGEPQAQFNLGKAAMAIEKGQYLATFEKESGHPASDLGVVPMPVAEKGTPGSIYYSNGIMILTNNAKKKAAIAKFFDYLYEPETYGRFINAEPGLFLPVTETGSKAANFWNDPVIAKYKEQVNVLTDAAKNGYLFGFTNGVSSQIGKIGGPNYIAQTLQKIIINGMSPAEAVKWGQQQMEAAVK